jgi:ribosomal protein S18 acetylase RimI-like enzyme
MKERVQGAPDLFLVAVDQSTGRLAGFLNGLATNESVFRDEFFTNVNLHDPEGKNVMLLGLDVLPEHQRRGLGRKLVCQYAERERDKDRQTLILTCLKSKVKMYEKMGFTDRGIANSTWGGEEWHEMSLRIGM